MNRRYRRLNHSIDKLSDSYIMVNLTDFLLNHEEEWLQGLFSEKSKEKITTEDADLYRLMEGLDD